VLAAGLELAETLQSKAATADLLALARRARLRTPTAEVSAPTAPTASSAEQPFGLTAREREVLSLIVGGFSNSEIGSRLSMSDSTASVHVSHILSKLGVTTRVEAAAIAIRSGLDS
jgi:DNA-binding NarL/FixJ family response regulator